jgi:parallel beta-helix repeat protein
VQSVYLENASDDAIYVTNSSSVKILDNTVDRFYKHAIDVSDESASFHSSDIIISRNTVDGKWHGAYDGITVDAYTPQSIVISENTVKNVINSTLTGLGYWESGIHVEDRNAGVSDNDTITITDNAVRDCQRGITAASVTSTTISNNVVTNATTVGIHLANSAGILVQGNVVLNSHIYGIKVEGGQNRLISNIIKNSAYYAIYAYGDEVTYRDPQLLIADNEIQNTTFHGVYTHDFPRLQVIGNMFLDSSLSATNSYMDLCILAESSRQSYNNTIMGNSFRSMGAILTAYQIYLGPYVSSTLILGNVFDVGGATSKIYNSTTVTIAYNIGYP